MDEERVKKGARGRPSTAALSYSGTGSESESDDAKLTIIDSQNEDKSSTAAENTAKDDGREEVDEEEDEEEESDEEEEEEDDEEEESDDDDDDDEIGGNKKGRKKMTILESESSDDGEGDDCPICLNHLKYQDIGTPESCDHNFCLDCIQLWARNVNTCPVDRREFQLILARHAKEDEIFKRIPVTGKSCLPEEDEEDVNLTYCEVCGRSDREDRLLLCDGCDLGFHCECLVPPLDSVPVEEWFCPDCAEANTQRSGRLSNDLDDDMQYLLEENSLDGVPHLRPRRRQIARTRISERVRARIQEYREGLARLVCDDEEPEASDEEGEGPSTRLSRTRSQTRQSDTKRKPPSRRKGKKGRAGKQKSGPRRKLRRRTKTPGKAQLFERLRNANKSKSSKSRLAGKLGLTKPRMGLRKSDRTTSAQILKEDLYGAKPLSIMGGKHDLDPFVEDDSQSRSDEPQASTSVFSAAAAAKRSSKYSASALLSRQPVARPLQCKLPEENFAGNSAASSAASSSGGGGGGLDLLGSIMMDQSILHLESKDVKINRDGSLAAKKVPATAVEEPKTKKRTSSLFFDSKGDENTSVHMESDNEESTNNNADENKENTEQNDDTAESDGDTKFSDVEYSDNETKPSNVENASKVSDSANPEEDGGEQNEKAKNESENAEESFESNEANKAVEDVDMKDDEDSSRDGLEINTEVDDENVSPEKEEGDNSEAECEDNEEEAEEEEKSTYKDEQKDDNVSEHAEDEKASSEVGSSGFSPARCGSPEPKSRDEEQNSDAEDTSLVKGESQSDGENVEKDASESVEKMDESDKVSESAQDEQQAVSDAEEDEDITAKDDDSVKSDAEENAKDVDEAGPKSDAEDEDNELTIKSDAEDEDNELTIKSDAEDQDAEEPVDETSMHVKSDAEGEGEEENVLKETEEEEEEEGNEADGDADKFVTEEGGSPDAETMQDEALPSESNETEEQEFPKAEESDDNGETLAAENLDDQNEEEKDSKLEVADEASENFDDAASKDSEEMVKTQEELETFDEQNEVGEEEQNEAGDEEVDAVSGSESEMSSAGNEEEEEEEVEGKKPKVPISELPRIPKRNRREGSRREKSSKGDGPELKSVLGRVDMPEYKVARSWDKKDRGGGRSRWDPDEWSQSERDIDSASQRDRKSEGGKSYHSDRSESSKDSEKYSFEYKESKSRKRRRDRSRSRSRGRKDKDKDKEKEKEKENAVEYRDIPHRRHSPERSKSRRRDRSRNRSRSGSREKSFDYDKSHKRKSRGRGRDRSQSRKSRRHRSYSRSPSRKRDKERSSSAKRRHREERRRGEERGHKRHSDKSDPDETRKKRQSQEEYDDWDDGSIQVVDFDEASSPRAASGKKSAECFYESHSPNEEYSENFFNRRTPQEKGSFKGDKMDESGNFYSGGRSSGKKNKYVDRFYKAPHLRHTGTEKFPISLSDEENEEFSGSRSKASRSEERDKDRDAADSGDSEYDPAFPTESGSPFREEAAEEPPTPPEEPAAPVVAAVPATAPTVTTSAAVVAPAAEEIASSGPIDENQPPASQGILGESGFMIAENPNLQNIQMQPQNLTFPMGIRMMPPGMQPGMPQHLLMNPMFLNRPPPFGRLPRISGPVGRIGWSMNPSGIMQIPPNRFGPTRMGPGGGMPPGPGLLNGGFEGMPQEPGQPMAPFKQHPCDPRSMPSHASGPQGPPGQMPRPGLAGHPPPHMPHLPPPGPLLPHPQQHPPPPPPSSQQMHIPPPSDTLSSSSQPSSDDKSVSSNFRELNQITKLLEAQINKQRNTAQGGSDIDVFKIPLPPMAPPSIPPPTLGLPLVPPPDSHNFTSTTKSYKNGQSRLLANSHAEVASESTEVVDMDVASPLDDEIAIELPASPEFDDIDESKLNMKDSANIEASVSEDMPASAVELTNLTNKDKHTSRVKKGNPKASQQRTASPTSTKTSHMGYMKKLQIQERVVDEVKLAIKPFYSGKKIDKNEYKEILRKAVPKICHSKSGNINPAKIKALIESYVDKMCKTRKYMERKKKISMKANGERIKKPSR